MTSLAWALLAVAAVAAVADWAAVARGDDRFRPVTKTLAMASLVGVALALHPVDGAARWAVVAAAVVSLLGDVLLLPQVDVFEGGLAAFLAGHLAYVVAFVLLGLRWPLVAAAAVLLAAFLATVGRRIVLAVREGHPDLLLPVVAYVATISAMAALAAGTGRALTAVGAALFVASDSQLAWDRFVRPDRRLQVGVITSYHVAQALLVVGMARG